MRAAPATIVVIAFGGCGADVPDGLTVRELTIHSRAVGHARVTTRSRVLRAGGVRARVHTWPGGHDGDYWDAHWRDYLRFYARALERC